ncbi:MAG: hypothetical protein NT062_31260 [Proteobacteria bacterium]|nr:hypothetical protein [Pseudomonadota bacterium]
MRGGRARVARPVGASTSASVTVTWPTAIATCSPGASTCSPTSGRPSRVAASPTSGRTSAPVTSGNVVAQVAARSLPGPDPIR